MQNLYTYILAKLKFAFHSSANMYSRLLTIYIWSLQMEKISGVYKAGIEHPTVEAKKYLIGSN